MLLGKLPCDDFTSVVIINCHSLFVRIVEVDVDINQRDSFVRYFCIHSFYFGDGDYF